LKPPRNYRHAFTLLELMVVVVVIGLLAALAIAAFTRLKERSLASRMANDFRQYAAAFQRYALENGGWPAATTTAGAIPTNMGPYLPASFAQGSALGGGYTWSGPSARLRLINVSNVTCDPIVLRVDALLDDGNLSTGDFTSMTSGGYHWQLH
jgi:prepilin-type N-terminal cleavage/methylation domain-containing protein